MILKKTHEAPFCSAGAGLFAKQETMKNSIIRSIQPIGLHFETKDPFLFCAHHKDDYPAGNEEMGPQASLAGRNIGEDFTLKDGWRMYHGEFVPGFPEHPHRGFETVTVVLKGFVDHSDSFGAAGRYGNGDVQWMTAGSGMQHAEMFPLIHADRPNPAELFQIWLNLPARDKMVEPHYKMIWDHQIPRVTLAGADQRKVHIKLIAGSYDGKVAEDPAPDSWASDPGHQVSIHLIELDPLAHWTLPAAAPELNRMLYYYEGEKAMIAGEPVWSSNALDIPAEAEVPITNGEKTSRFLLLQGLPIGDPVAQYGPFVMNTQQEIRQAISDYQRTQFGGWPWSRRDPVHPRNKGRFARYADGREEVPNK